MAYIYQADNWCHDCGQAICRRLAREGKAPAHPEDERTFDSDEYPKRVGDDEEADTPQHCAAGAECLSAIMLPSSRKVGLLFGELTRDGVEYVERATAEAAAQPGANEVVALWRRHYTEKGYELPPLVADLAMLVREFFCHVDRAGHAQTRVGGTAQYDVLVPIPAGLLRRMRAACAEPPRPGPAAERAYRLRINSPLLRRQQALLAELIAQGAPRRLSRRDREVLDRVLAILDELADQARKPHCGGQQTP